MAPLKLHRKQCRHSNFKEFIFLVTWNVCVSCAAFAEIAMCYKFQILCRFMGKGISSNQLNLNEDVLKTYVENTYFYQNLVSWNTIVQDEQDKVFQNSESVSRIQHDIDIIFHIFLVCLKVCCVSDKIKTSAITYIAMS